MSESQTPEEIAKDIEAQREKLAETVDQLAAKLDVKSQASAKVAQVKTQVKAGATTPDGKPKPAVLAGAGGALAAVLGAVGFLVWRRRS